MISVTYVPLITDSYTVYCDCDTGELTRTISPSNYECFSGTDFIDSNGSVATKSESLYWTIGLSAIGIEESVKILKMWKSLKNELKIVGSELYELNIYAPSPKYFPTTEFCIGRFNRKVRIVDLPIQNFMAPLSLVDIINLNGIRHPDFTETTIYNRFANLLIEIALDENGSNWSGYSKRMVLSKESYIEALNQNWLSKYTVKRVICLKHGCYVELPESLSMCKSGTMSIPLLSIFLLICEHFPDYFISHLKQRMAFMNRSSNNESFYFSPHSIGVD